MILDRTNRTIPTFFQSNLSPSNNDTYQRGYIFSFDQNTGYSILGTNSGKFMVGAPFHFYFGVVVGESALDKFKTKYLAGE